jgi:hypothetical protein
MDTIPEELKKRWAEKDSLQASPRIAVINLTDHAPLPPELDFLEDAQEFFPKTLPPPPAHSPWIDLKKLHGSQSVSLPAISIATYAYQKNPTTDRHS